MTASLTPTAILSGATSTLEGGGYSVIEGERDWQTSTSRLFEDPYNIVGVVVYPTWAELMRGWSRAQGSLVSTISSHLTGSEAKAWDGYLVLLTPSSAPKDGLEIESIRSDMQRLRKLVATGDDLVTPQDFGRVLSALLPLNDLAPAAPQPTVLDLLPRLLATHGIDEATTETIVKAFQDHAPLLERLHTKGQP